MAVALSKPVAAKHHPKSRPVQFDKMLHNHTTSIFFENITEFSLALQLCVLSKGSLQTSLLQSFCVLSKLSLLTFAM